jgi:hypothetical protein
MNSNKKRLAGIVSFSLIILLLHGCFLFGKALHWHGSWTGQSLSGSFSADLILALDDTVSGSVTFENHPLGTFQVTGTRSDEYGGTDHYEQLDLHNSDNSATISLLKGGWGLTDDSTLSGILSYGAVTYFVNIAP